MGTSVRGRGRRVEETAAELGSVTLEEEQAGVYLEGERRWTQVYSPGGYCWRPALGDQVLVLKAGGERESPCIIGRKQAGELQPGEVALTERGGKAAVRLRRDGELALEGDGTVNGVGLNTLIENIVWSIIGV